MSRVGGSLCPFFFGIGQVAIVSARLVALMLKLFPEWWLWSVTRHWRIGPVWLVWRPSGAEMPPRPTWKPEEESDDKP